MNSSASTLVTLIISVRVLRGGRLRRCCTPLAWNGRAVASHPAVARPDTEFQAGRDDQDPVRPVEVRWNEARRTKRFPHAVLRRLDERSKSDPTAQCQRKRDSKRTDGPARPAKDTEVMTSGKRAKRIAESLLVRAIGDLDPACQYQRTGSRLGLDQERVEIERLLRPDISSAALPLGERVLPATDAFQAAGNTPLPVVRPASLGNFGGAHIGVAGLKLGTVNWIHCRAH